MRATPKFPMVKADRRNQVTDRQMGRPVADTGDRPLTSMEKTEQRRADRARNRAR